MLYKTILFINVTFKVPHNAAYILSSCWQSTASCESKDDLFDVCGKLINIIWQLMSNTFQN